MQKELQLNKASSVNNYKPNKKGITKCKKRLNTKSHISRPEKTKSNSVLYAGALGDITTDNVYEIDAYDDNELGCSAGIPPSEKVLKKLGKIKKKRTRKLKSARATAGVEPKGKSTHVIPRSVAYSSDVKRSFFENNLCALNFLSPQKVKKMRPTASTAYKQNNEVTKNGKSANTHSTVQVSLFGNMTNKPEASAWVRDRDGQSTFNGDVGSSLEYDGDVFLPSGMQFSYI